MPFLVCASGTLTSSEVVGVWSNSDGAEMRLEVDGQFTVRAMSRQVLLGSDVVGPPLDGRGTWSLRKGGTWWEVQLHFKEMDGAKRTFGTSVFAEGKGTGMYLFGWVDEPGGVRYQLMRRL